MQVSLSSYHSFVVHFQLLWLLCTCNLFRGCQSFAKYKYSNRIVRTKYGSLQGIIIQELQVELFLGVPYATPPLGSLRFMPPVTPSMWTKTRTADTFSSVCPQKLPDISNRTEALLQIPRDRLVYLEKLLPLLTNQSEDCLYVNIYVPKTSISSNNIGLIPTILYIHGESYEWNAGNPYDGSVLAGYGNVVVVTINYRLGILGFLKTGNSNSTQGNYGLMDIIAGLHWLKENLSAFGGDPDRITVMGHSTGAALANFIAASPVTRELLHRVILLSGSGLSPWAIQRDPLMIKRKVAEQTNCHGDLIQEDMAPCLRMKKLTELLEVCIDSARFLPGFAPFVDGTVLQHGITESVIIPDILSLAKNKNGRGYELSDFPDRDLLFGTTSLESYWDFCAQDLEFGFGESRRDRVLRTFVRNCYYFHLNEIFSTLKNEYTNWERPVQSPLSIRDSTLDILSDGHTVSYLLKIGYLHSIRGGRTYFFHFAHQMNGKEFPQKFGSIRGDDVPFILGFPLLGTNQFTGKNFSEEDVQLCKQIIRYISNFARKGNPNGFASFGEKNANKDVPFWDAYDSVNQLYMELGSQSAVKSHYRGHKISVWLNLIPQLHQPGLGVFNMQHHHFQQDSLQYYDGAVRLQSHRPIFPDTSVSASTAAEPSSSATPSPSAVTIITASTAVTYKRVRGQNTSFQSSHVTECSNVSVNAAADTARTPGDAETRGQQRGFANNTLLQIITSRQYQNYATALTITIGVGCFLLLLNVFIFAGIYRQRENNAAAAAVSTRRNKLKRKSRDVENATRYERYPIGGKFLDPMPICYSSEASTSYTDNRDISPNHYEVATGGHRVMTKSTSTEHFFIHVPEGFRNNSDANDNSGGNLEMSPSIPEPPPAPITLPTLCYQSVKSSASHTLPSAKKTIQIQEISV